ncbi:MAG: sulfotransferase family protein [Chloroflexi bacterium]|nr:MAG: sulfotransferase family protein [Chloroflexota bacterium]
MKVIGAGYGRTGTLSLQLALEQLGFDPCYHMQTVIKRPRHLQAWDKIGQGEPADWLNLLQDYQAAVDFPISLYWRELMDVYPNAKFVLTVRDADSWYDSTVETIYQTITLKWLPNVLPPLKLFIRMVNDIIWDGAFNGRFLHRPHAIQKFEQHNADVQQTIPPERLLVFNVKEGWEPLCNFLQAPIPNTPFPHANSRRQIKMAIGSLHLIERITPWFAAGLIALLIRKFTRRL